MEEHTFMGTLKITELSHLISVKSMTEILSFFLAQPPEIQLILFGSKATREL